jgi:hypothetical protein|tara:strand:+ start:387 stop:656 length:270 start_codon:yes stop_codon:yes gene_type:complete
MGKLIFTYTDKDFIELNREASKIEFDIPDDMDINEYKVICVRLAAAMGYSNITIKKSFGDLIYGDDNKNELKELLNELNIKNNDKTTKK